MCVCLCGHVTVIAEETAAVCLEAEEEELVLPSVYVLCVCVCILYMHSSSCVWSRSQIV